MPYTIRKLKTCYEVVNTKTGRILARCTTKEKAEAQLRILRNLKNKT
jgi:hypothetical protein